MTKNGEKNKLVYLFVGTSSTIEISRILAGEFILHLFLLSCS